MTWGKARTNPLISPYTSAWSHSRPPHTNMENPHFACGKCFPLFMSACRDWRAWGGVRSWVWLFVRGCGPHHGFTHSLPLRACCSIGFSSSLFYQEPRASFFSIPTQRRLPSCVCCVCLFLCAFSLFSFSAWLRTVGPGTSPHVPSGNPSHSNSLTSAVCGVAKRCLGLYSIN